MSQKLEEILRSIEAGSAFPCCLLYGDESFLVGEALGRILHTLLPEGSTDFNCFMMDGGSVEVDSICEAVLTAPLIPGKKVVVVKNTVLFAAKASRATLPANFSDMLDENPAFAVRTFMNILALMGWSLEDLEQGGWRTVTAEEWTRIFAETAISDYAQVLPRVIELCSQAGASREPSPGDAGRLEGVISNGIPVDTTLILTSSAVDKRKKLYRAISETGVVLHFPREKSDALQKNLLIRKAQEYLAEQGKSLSAAAIALLGRRTGFDFEDVFGEIDKLVTYVGDEGSRIDESDVASAVARTREERIFELTEAFVERNPERGLRALRRLMEQDVHPLVLLGMLAREVRFLMQAQLLLESNRIPWSGEAPSYRIFQDTIYSRIVEMSGQVKKSKAFLTGQHPYVIFNALKNAGGVNRRELLRFMDVLVEADIALKSSGADSRLLMERLVIDLCGIERPRNNAVLCE